LDWRAKVELFEQIRREYEFGIGTIVGVAKKLGVHRRMVREAIGSALPRPRKKPERPRWKLKAAVEFVDAILEADRKAPRKQRHTAHRIWTRMQSELSECKIAERTVREYVHDRKIALGLNVRETCVPQSYAWGVEAQIDWYEAYADLGGERIKLQAFGMRSMASGAAFHCAYLHATQQAFLEAHELAFAYFGGVFRKLRYDNFTSAVKKILRGHRREETARFVAFRSHWRFEAEFCTPAEPHEKGGIEGEAGYFRRNHWVPVPEAAELADLNGQLLNACQQDEHRLIAGREQAVGAGMVIEREHLLPLATEGADLAQTSFPTVNGLGCVKVLTNTYSVSGSIAAGGDRRARAQHHRAAHSRSPPAARENAGRVRLHTVAECNGREDARPGGGRLYRTRRTSSVHRRMRHRQDASVDRSLRRRLPAEAPSPLHYGGRVSASTRFRTSSTSFACPSESVFAW